METSDVWVYDSSNNMFMMTTGGQYIGESYWEGEKNIILSKNTPAGRYSSSLWKLKNGNMAFFLGTHENYENRFPELWEFSPFHCFGVSGLHSAVCSSNGKCVGTDICECLSSNVTENCGSGCFGYDLNSPSRCFGHGNCVHDNLCRCNDGYSGDQCEIWSCFNISRLIFGVCSGKGICDSLDHCSCDEGLYGDQCEFFSCFGIGSSNDSFVCGGKGSCIAQDVCDCQIGNYGKECTEWGCFNISSTHSNVCGGKGKCVSSDICECTDLDYQGPFCSYTGGFTFGIVSAITAPLVLVGVLIVVVIIAVLVACLCSCGKKLKKVEGLEGIDILLEEQKAAKNTSIAHLNINKDFFKVKYSDVQLKKVIGEGGGEACVYLADWHSQEVAVKIFKIREMDEEKYKAFENEVKIQSSLHHPNVLRFLGAIMEENKVGFIMELCKNGDLEHF